MTKVLVAMSGGVDSSVAAAILKDQGYDVIGMTMQLWRKGSREKIADAKRVSSMLGIPHYTLKMEKLFEKKVVRNFVDEYCRGRTPNPCIKCNEHIKFEALMAAADKLRADYVATGHYAKINVEQCRYSLLKGDDRTKDQSYVLYTLDQKKLARVLFPLGGLTKKDVRAMAKKLKLPVADKEESQDICFIPDNDYGAFIKGKIGDKVKEGAIINCKGRILGRHSGIIHYTIGQRRGLGISSPEPLYVTAIDSGKNRIIVGGRKEVLGKELVAEDVRYVSEEAPRGKFAVNARIRYNAKEAPATVIQLRGSRCRVAFKTPQNAITPGQSVVFYKGDEVLGGGIIEKKLG
jgi:tRNA-specific 2-thiouridylase